MAAPDNLASFFTTTVVNSTLDIPDGATEIFFNNIGLANARWKGNRKNGDQPSDFVVLEPDNTFAYGYIGRGRKGFQLDATGTTVEVSITF